MFSLCVFFMYFHLQMLVLLLISLIGSATLVVPVSDYCIFILLLHIVSLKSRFLYFVSLQM